MAAVAACLWSRSLPSIVLKFFLAGGYLFQLAYPRPLALHCKLGLKILLTGIPNRHLIGECLLVGRRNQRPVGSDDDLLVTQRARRRLLRLRLLVHVEIQQSAQFESTLFDVLECSELADSKLVRARV